jgi:GNAT superfamily N-acetyltransferase
LLEIVTDTLSNVLTPRRAQEKPDLLAVHALLRAEFAYMNERIDPWSSIDRLTVEDLSRGTGEVWVIGEPPLACIVLTPKQERLYVGKLAVSAAQRGNGLARLLVDHADLRAQQLGLTWLELETRIELTENQQTFEAMGFSEFQRTSHPGYEHVTSITFRRAVPS